MLETWAILLNPYTAHRLHSPPWSCRARALPIQCLPDHVDSPTSSSSSSPPSSTSSSSCFRFGEPCRSGPVFADGRAPPPWQRNSPSCRPHAQHFQSVGSCNIFEHLATPLSSLIRSILPSISSCVLFLTHAMAHDCKGT